MVLRRSLRPQPPVRAVTFGVIALLAFLPVPLAPAHAILLATAAVLAWAAVLLPWRGSVVPISAVGVAVVSLVVDVLDSGPAGPVWLWLPLEAMGLLVLLGRVVRGATSRQVGPVAATVAVAVAVLPLRAVLRMDDAGSEQAVVLCALMLLPITTSVLVGAYLRSVASRGVAAVRQARHEQRLQMARDLHDSVAHEVTGILVEVQAAKVGEVDREQRQALLDRLEDAAGRALDSMDKIVHTLRTTTAGDDQEPPAPGLADLAPLVARFSQTGGPLAELRIDPALSVAVPPLVSSAAYRVVLEALTNIRRHATQTSMVVVWAGTDAVGTVEVTVADDGRQNLPASDGRYLGGTGLIDMADRVQVLGGSLTAGPDRGGWVVRATFPIDQTPGRRFWRRGRAAG